MSGLLLIVRLAGERIAVPTDTVEAVVEIESVAPVPRAAGHVAGLAALRSRVLTVIDGSAALGLGATPPRDLADAILVGVEGHSYALLVDAVEDVVEHEGDPVAVRNALGAGWSRVACGMVECGGELLLMIDPAAVVAGPPAETASAA